MLLEHHVFAVLMIIDHMVGYGVYIIHSFLPAKSEITGLNVLIKWESNLCSHLQCKDLNKSNWDKIPVLI